MKCIRLDFTALFAYIFAGVPREMKNALPFEGNEKSRRSMRTMKRIANLFGNLRFRDKLTLSTLVASLIPLMLFSVVVGTIVMREVSRKSQQLSLQMVTQTSESLDVYIGTIEKLMDVVIAEGGELPTAQDGQAQNLQKLSRDILQAYPEIAGITIAYPDDSYIGEGMTRISRDRFADEYWYQYAAKQDGQLGIIGSAIGRNVVNNLNESSDSIFSLVKSFETEGGCGVVLFDIRHTIIEKSIERVSIGEEGLLFVADDRDVVYTPVSDVVYRIDRECYENVGGASEKIRIGGKNYFVVNYYSPYSRWRMVGVVPETEFSAGMHSLYQMFFVCVGISILLVAFASVTVSATVTQPVLRLCSSMERAEAGDFSVRFNTKYTDEIGVLGLSFNHMIERINNLINELYVERQVRLEAQLKSLQEQIKPHFLYNTNGGRQMVEDGIIDATVTCPTGGREAVRYAIDIINKVSGIPKQIILRSHKLRGGDMTDGEENRGKTHPEREVIRVGCAQIEEESNWRKASIESIQKAAKESGIDLRMKFNVLSIEEQMAQVREFIAEDVDVIVVTPLVAEGWQGLLEEARAAGIPVLLVDRMVTLDEELYESYIGGDFDEEGRRCARWLMQHTETMPRVSVLELRGTEGASPTEGRKRGFESVIAENDRCRIVYSGCGDFAREGGAQVVRDYLASNQGQWDIDAIFVHNDEMALGAIEVLKEYGINPGTDVKIMSIDGTADALTALQRGEINCVVKCNPLLGPELMKAITDLMQGKELPLRIITDEMVFTEDTPKEFFRNRKY